MAKEYKDAWMQICYFVKFEKNGKGIWTKKYVDDEENMTVIHVGNSILYDDLYKKVIEKLKINSMLYELEIRCESPTPYAELPMKIDDDESVKWLLAVFDAIKLNITLKKKVVEIEEACVFKSETTRLHKERMKRGNSMSLHDCSWRRKHCSGSVDRICDLPDSILSHILSFLPTENAVATHVLSQRWKYLWTMTDNLHFYCPYANYQRDQYVKFVSHVLLLHKPGSLNKLSLIWLFGCIPYHVNTWISAAVLRNVHELVVNVTISTLPIQVQRSMFSCESLQSLELDCAICISSEIAVLFQDLKV